MLIKKTQQEIEAGNITVNEVILAFIKGMLIGNILCVPIDVMLSLLVTGQSYLDVNSYLTGVAIVDTILILFSLHVWDKNVLPE